MIGLFAAKMSHLLAAACLDDPSLGRGDCVYSVHKYEYDFSHNRESCFMFCF